VRKLVSLLVVVALTAALVMSAVAFAATKKVGVKGLAFAVGGKATKSLKVKRGTTVKWSWSGSIPHNVVGKGFKSKTAAKGSVSHKFTKKGTYTVVCTLHKTAGMTMKVKVS
jgi:plastocyanin